MDLSRLEGWTKRGEVTAMGDHSGLRIERSNETHWGPRAEMLQNSKVDLKCLYDHLCARLAD